MSSMKLKGEDEHITEHFSWILHTYMWVSKLWFNVVKRRN